jgi:hypothetical protein
MDDDDDVEDIIADTTASKSSWQPPVAAYIPKASRGLFASRYDLKTISITNLYFEIIFAASIIAYIAGHYYGRQLNLGIAKTWFQAVLPVLQTQFAKVGDEKNFTLIRDGPRDYIFFASGREFVKTLYGYIEVSEDCGALWWLCLMG